MVPTMKAATRTEPMTMIGMGYKCVRPTAGFQPFGKLAKLSVVVADGGATVVGEADGGVVDEGEGTEEVEGDDDDDAEEDVVATSPS